MSARATRELSGRDTQYGEHGSAPKVLDIIQIPFLAPQPLEHQQENHLIDAGIWWRRVGVASWAEIQSAVEDPAGPLWFNGDSSYNGVNDRVPVSHLHLYRRSLYLVRPANLEILVATEDYDGRSKLKVRADFDLCGASYRFAVTDPTAMIEHKAKGEGTTAVPEALLCLSLGEIFNGYAYKLVAAVITPHRTSG